MLLPAAHSIPHELGDLIVSHLDKASLEACTLLSRDDVWLSAARARLFSTLTIHNIAKDPDHDFDSFRRFVASGTPRTTEYTKVLVLCGEEGLQGQKKSAIDVYDLLRILENFPDLRTLQLKDLWLQTCGAGPSYFDRDLLPKQLSSIGMTSVTTSLVLDYSSYHGNDWLFQDTLPSESSFVELLACFPSVKIIDIQEISFNWDFTMESTEYADPALHANVAIQEGKKLPDSLRLETLAILGSTCRYQTFILYLLLSSGAIERLKHLSILHPQNGHLEINKVLPCFGWSVTHLDLSFKGINILHPYEISGFKVLRALRLLVENFPCVLEPLWDFRGERLRAVMETALNAPRTLKSLTFELRYDCRPRAQGLWSRSFWRNTGEKWSQLDAALSEAKNHPTLTFALVKVKQPGARPSQDLYRDFRTERRHIKGCLQRLSRNKRLTLQYGEVLESFHESNGDLVSGVVGASITLRVYGAMVPFVPAHQL